MVNVCVNPIIEIEDEEMSTTNNKRNKRDESEQEENNNSRLFHKHLRVVDSGTPEAIRGALDGNHQKTTLLSIDELEVCVF